MGSSRVVTPLCPVILVHSTGVFLVDVSTRHPTPEGVWRDQEWRKAYRSRSERWAWGPGSGTSKSTSKTNRAPHILCFRSRRASFSCPRRACVFYCVRTVLGLPLPSVVVLGRVCGRGDGVESRRRVRQGRRTWGVVGTLDLGWVLCFESGLRWRDTGRVSRHWGRRTVPVLRKYT